MTTITIDDALMNEVIAISHQQNPQDAVIKVLGEYLKQHKHQPGLFDQLRLADNHLEDDLALLFERDKDTGRNIEL